MSNGQPVEQPIGQTLAAARLEAGLSLAQVSERTRLRAAQISALEADDFSRCGGDFYARAHIRAVAQAVGTDPAPLLARYDAQQGLQDERTVRDLLGTDLRGERERRGVNWSAAMALALTIVVIYGGARVLTSDGPTRRATTLAEPQAPARQSARPSSSSPPAERPRASNDSGNAIAAVRRDDVTVKVTAPSGTSWVSVTDGSGTTRFEGLLDEGDQRSFTDRRALKLTIGNAGAIALTVNGKKLGAPGRDGEVVRVRFTPDDPVS